MKKLSLLIAAGAGYVLGTRAGQERYEQIKAQATRAWNNPKVQDTVDGVQTQAKQTGADVGHKVASAAEDVKSKVSDRSRDDESYPPAGPSSL